MKTCCIIKFLANLFNMNERGYFNEPWKANEQNGLFILVVCNFNDVR
jgi:hypothetical protein